MSRRISVPWWLGATGAIFALAMIGLVAVSLRRPEPQTFALTSIQPRGEADSLLRPSIVTLDARDPKAWTWFDFSSGEARTDPGPVDWDLGVRRFRLIVNGGDGFAGAGGAQRLADRFGDVRTAPPDGYSQSRVTPGGDTLSKAFEHWYSYGFFSHLLEPKHGTYVLRTSEGLYVKLRILGYYCPGPEPGCLTIEYVIQGDGSRRLR